MDGGTTLSDPVKSLAGSPGLQSIYETAPIGLAFLSPDCRYILINQHLTEICGISIADHIGRSVRETVPQLATQVEQIVETILRCGEPITGVEVHGQRPDGSNTDRVWITYWHPMKNAAGDILGINVAAEEITERKRAEAERAAIEERLRKLNETLAERVEEQAKERDRLWNLSRDLLVVIDFSGRIVSANPAWSAILGWSPQDLVGKSADSFIHPADRASARSELAKLATGEGRHFDNRILCKDGSFRWLSWLAVPGQETVYAVARDITQLKGTQEQLHRTRRQLAQASRQHTMSAMTASIAHEIKQPLAAIVARASAAVRWLNKPKPDLTEVRAALQRIVEDGDRINDVVGSVRAMFTNSAADKHPVDVRATVGEVLALAQGELDAHQIVLRNEIGDKVPMVMADRVQLQQVLLNLIMNAIEAMSSITDRERQLTIASGVDEKNVRITVEDSGSGIEPEYRDRIFDTFFTTKSNGMGVGLAVCRSIIEAYRGKLWATPRTPFGTAFHLTLQGVRTNETAQSAAPQTDSP
jgi:PAS domain S-box-containing protein